MKIGESFPAAGAQLLRRLDLPAPSEGGPHRQIAGVRSMWGGALAMHDAFNDPGSGGWRLDRQRFEQELRAAAISHGVTWLTDLVRGLERDGAGWRIDTALKTRLRAETVIDATGRRAALSPSHRRSTTTPTHLSLRSGPRGPLNPVRTRLTLILKRLERAGGMAHFCPAVPPSSHFTVHRALAAACAKTPSRWCALFAETRLIASALPASWLPLIQVEMCRCTGADPRYRIVERVGLPVGTPH